MPYRFFGCVSTEPAVESVFYGSQKLLQGLIMENWSWSDGVLRNRYQSHSHQSIPPILRNYSNENSYFGFPPFGD